MRRFGQRNEPPTRCKDPGKGKILETQPGGRGKNHRQMHLVATIHWIVLRKPPKKAASLWICWLMKPTSGGCSKCANLLSIFLAMVKTCGNTKPLLFALHTRRLSSAKDSGTSCFGSGGPCKSARCITITSLWGSHLATQKKGWLTILKMRICPANFDSLLLLKSNNWSPNQTLLESIGSIYSSGFQTLGLLYLLAKLL